MSEQTPLNLEPAFTDTKATPQIIRVMPDQMAFTTSEDTSPIILTEFTNVCSGIGVLNNGAPAIGGVMHIFSSEWIGTSRTREEIQDKVTQAWEMFRTEMNKRAPDETKFECCIFGARTKESLGAPDDIGFEIVEYNSIVTTLEAEEKKLKAEFPDPLSLSGDEYFRALGEFVKRHNEIEKPYADWAGYDMFGNTPPGPVPQYLTDCRLHNAWLSSHVIAKALYDLALEEPRFSKVHDYRFNGSPHDFALNTQTKEMSLRPTPIENHKSAGDPKIRTTSQGVQKVSNDFDPFSAL